MDEQWMFVNSFGKILLKHDEWMHIPKMLAFSIQLTVHLHDGCVTKLNLVLVAESIFHHSHN